MTYRVEDTALERVFELLAEEGFDGMSQALEVLLNEMMKLGAVKRENPARACLGIAGIAEEGFIARGFVIEVKSVIPAARWSGRAAM